MALAAIIKFHEDLMICDLAETYHILDYKGLPVKTLATLVSGLRADSRIARKLVGLKDTNTTALLAQLLDGVNGLVWAIAGDKDHRPKSVFNMLIEKEREETGFETGADYEKARADMIRRIKDGKR